MSWYIKVLKNYAVFEGRASRKEYWMFFLCSLVVSVALSIVDMATGITNNGNPFGISTLYALAVLLPGIAVSVRRLHDTGRSGWSLLLALIPFVGAILLLVYYCQDSQPGDNQYGPNPKAEFSAGIPQSAVAHP